jgi:hypothetical protein
MMAQLVASLALLVAWCWTLRPGGSGRCAGSWSLECVR